MSENGIPIDISQDSDYQSVFLSSIDSKTLLMIADFFQYRTANSYDSPLSLKIDLLLSEAQKDELFKRLLDSANILDSDILFSSILRNNIKEIREMELSDLTLRCDRIKGFFHQNNQPMKNGLSQHKIDSLFKHVRDAFAHGRIASVEPFLLLEDKKKQLTGRLIITIDALLKWKIVVEEYLQEISKINSEGEKT